jgi:polyferredoxin
LAKAEKEIEARVDARLADRPRPRRRELDPATLAKRRLALKYAALGSVAVGIPLTWLGWYMINMYWHNPFPGLVIVWILIAAVYAAVSVVCLGPSRRDRE